METKELIARKLLDIGAVFLRPEEPFIWASGIKSPIYTDNRLTLTAPAVRLDIEEAFAALIRERFPDAEALVGTATAGIAHAAITAHILGLPMGYVRGSVKDHGRQNRIEGRFNKGEKVVVVEDLVSTGASVLDAVSALSDYGLRVLGVVCIFTYGLAKSIERFHDEGVPLFALTDLDAVVAEALKRGSIGKADSSRILKFRLDPADESWIFDA